MHRYPEAPCFGQELDELAHGALALGVLFTLELGDLWIGGRDGSDHLVEGRHSAQHVARRVAHQFEAASLVRFGAHRVQPIVGHDRWAWAGGG